MKALRATCRRSSRGWSATVRAASFTVAFLIAAGAWAGETRESDLGGVHIAVTPACLEEDVPLWDFAVAFQSAGPALDDEMLASASLFVDGSAQSPIAWQEIVPSETHHRAGVLRFVAPTEASTLVELRLRRTGEARPRVFRWYTGGWLAFAR